VAVNCCVAPFATDGFAGVTAMDDKVAEVTVSTVEPVMLPLLAEIEEVPIPTPVAKPVPFIVATEVAAEAHVAVLLRSCVELSLNVPVAVNCCVVPLAIDGFAGVTAMETSVGGVTVSVVEPVTPFSVAEIEEVPVATAVARPPVLMVATEVVADAHITLLVRFCVELSLYVPVAVNCWVVPLAMDGLVGVTAID
jgi:hypothetical protein